MLSIGLRESLPWGTATRLGTFTPSSFTHAVIATELEQWLRARGVVAARVMGGKGRLPIGIRSPSEQSSNAYIREWHHDGADWMIVWSNKTPTPLSIGQFDPFDVVLVDDRLVQHKAPPIEEGRWFARLLDPIFKD